MRPKRQPRSQGTVLLVLRGTVGDPWERGCPNDRIITRLVTPGKVEQVSCLRKQRVGKVRTICCYWFEPVPADPKFEKQHQREANDLQCIRQRLNFHSCGKFFLLLFSVCS